MTSNPKLSSPSTPGNIDWNKILNTPALKSAIATTGLKKAANTPAVLNAIKTFDTKNALVVAQTAFDTASASLKVAQKEYALSKKGPHIASIAINSFSSVSYSTEFIKVTLVTQNSEGIAQGSDVFIEGLSTYVGQYSVFSLIADSKSVNVLVPHAKFKLSSNSSSNGTLYYDKGGNGFSPDSIGAAYLRLVAAKAKVASTADALDKAKKAVSKLVSGSKPPAKPIDVPAPTVVTGSDYSPVTYNLPSVKEAYFSTSSSVKDASDRTKTYDSEVLFVDSGNRPAKVNEAQTLWMDTQAHKGMFQTFIVPKADATKNVGSNTKGIKGRQAQQNLANVGRYGFQFLYNPGTISMDYSGAPNIDPGLMMSNQQMIPLIGASNTSSSISFNLILNRMPDMKYLTNGSLTSSEFSSIYGGTPPEDYQTSLDKIRDSGTMYDVEFLLQTLLGYEAWSTLRNRYSSDIGYIGSFPVELHLGKSLRYVVLVQDISVTHTIFTKDMVPVYTNISIMAGRLPDSGFNTLLHSYKAPSEDLFMRHSDPVSRG